MLLEKLNQGIRARIPTAGTPTALPLLGADRLIPRGLGDTDAGYAKRLQQALDDWQVAGSARAILRQTLAYIGFPATRARLVSSSSVWDTFTEYADTTKPPVHYPAPVANWDWDSLMSPPTVQGWWRVWLILYSSLASGEPLMTIVGATNATPIVVTVSKPHGLATGAAVNISGVLGNLAALGHWRVTVVDALSFSLNYSAGSGAYTSGGSCYTTFCAPAPVIGAPGFTIGGDPNVSIGLSIPASEIASIRQIAGLWKGAHSWVRWIVVSFSGGFFDPRDTLPSSLLPDGQWGRWSKVVNGVRVPSRLGTARYCDGVT